MHSFQSQISPCIDIAIPKTQFKFMDLNLDCQMLIMEQVDIFSLISLFETNKHFHALAIDIFQRKFSKKTLKYVTSFGGVTEIDRSTPASLNSIFTRRFGVLSPDDSIITINHFETFLKALKYFGHMISALKFKMSQYDPNRNEMKEIIKDHDWSTLIRLEIDSDDEQLFNYFTKPFANVEHLSLAGHFDRLNNSAFSLNELFPAIRSLSFGDIEVTNPNSIACEFQHLKDLQLIIDDHEDLERIPEVEFQNLIKKNAQIESMQIDHGDIQFLKFVSDELKNLEILTLLWYNEYYPNGITNVHFENVKKFTIYNYSPNYITFRNLVELETNLDPLYLPKWNEYVRANHNLQKLLWTGLYMRRDEFMNLVSENSNLVEIYVVCQADVDYVAIVDMLNKCNKLEKLHLDFVNFTEFEEPLYHLKEILRENLRGKWIINDGYFWNEFTIKRKIVKANRFPMDESYGF